MNKRHDICGCGIYDPPTPMELARRRYGDDSASNTEINRRFIEYIAKYVMKNLPNDHLNYIKNILTYNARDAGIRGEFKPEIANQGHEFITIDSFNKYCSVCMQARPNPEFTNYAHDKMLAMSRFPQFIYTCCNECAPDLGGKVYDAHGNLRDKISNTWQTITRKHPLDKIYAKFLLRRDMRHTNTHEINKYLTDVKKYKLIQSYKMLEQLLGRDIAKYIYAFNGINIRLYLFKI